MQLVAVVTAAWAGGRTFVEEQCSSWEQETKYDDRQGRDALTRRNTGTISAVQNCLGTQNNWEGNRRSKSKLSFLVTWYTLVVHQTSLLPNTTLSYRSNHGDVARDFWPCCCGTLDWQMLLLYFFWDLENPHPCYMVLDSPCIPNLCSFHTPLRHWTCELCTAFWGCMDRCGHPRPHSKLGKSKPVQIWKSCICTDLTTWVQPWATPATQIPEVGGIQLAWEVSEANVCLSAPVLVNIYESTASLLGK